MFCPNCGTGEQSLDSYCKRCGTYLRDVSLRGWLLGGNNPGRAAWSIAVFSLFAAAICLCASVIVVRAEKSGDLGYLKYAFVLCWAVIGYLVALSLTCFRLWKKMRRAQGGPDAAALSGERGGDSLPGQRAGQLSGAEGLGEAATELLRSTPVESERRRSAR